MTRRAISDQMLARILRDGRGARFSGPPRIVYLGDAVPARAATPSGPSLLRVSGIAGIAIATISLAYFIAQLVRVSL